MLHTDEGLSKPSTKRAGASSNVQHTPIGQQAQIQNCKVCSSPTRLTWSGVALPSPSLVKYCQPCTRTSALPCRDHTVAVQVRTQRPVGRMGAKDESTVPPFITPTAPRQQGQDTHFSVHARSCLRFCFCHDVAACLNALEAGVPEQPSRWRSRRSAMCRSAVCRE